MSVRLLAIELLVTNIFQTIVIEKIDIAKHFRQSHSSIYRDLLSSFRAIVSNAVTLNSELTYKAVKDLLNVTKNQFKHFRTVNDDQVEILELDTYFSLVRVALKCIILYLLL